MAVDVLVPDLVFEVTNEKDTVSGMARAISKAVKQATAAGKDARGRRMPKPKDAGTQNNPNGKPLNRTGRLLANIRPVEKKTRKSKTGKKAAVKYAVKSDGKRPKSENLAAKKKRAREKTRQARAAAVMGEAFGKLGTGRGLHSSFEAKKRGSGMKLSKIRFRTADTNAALAGILSAPPKDKRSKAGNRAQYRVFEASDQYIQLGGQVSNKLIKYRLRSKKQKKV
tara:strand:+ start:94 stop:768 length:675 start_codon:yes stop_codon:yes gene_type:complete